MDNMPGLAALLGGGNARKAAEALRLRQIQINNQEQAAMAAPSLAEALAAEQPARLPQSSNSGMANKNLDQKAALLLKQRMAKFD
jgi:hypothetical protein